MSPNTQEPPKSGCWPLGNGGTEVRAFVLDSVGGHDAPF